jgi:hypothetical protein
MKTNLYYETTNILHYKLSIIKKRNRLCRQYIQPSLKQLDVIINHMCRSVDFYQLFTSFIKAIIFCRNYRNIHLVSLILEIKKHCKDITKKVFHVLGVL